MKKLNLILAGGVATALLLTVGVLWSAPNRPPNPGQPKGTFQALPGAPEEVQLDPSFATPSEDSLKALGEKGQLNSVENPPPGCNHFIGTSYLWGWRGGGRKYLGVSATSRSDQSENPCCQIRYLDVYSELYYDGIPRWWAQGWAWDYCFTFNYAVFSYDASYTYHFDLSSEHCFNIPTPPPFCVTAFFYTWDQLDW